MIIITPTDAPVIIKYAIFFSCFPQEIKKAKLYTRCAKLLEKIEYAIICGTVINKIGRLRFPASTFASTKENNTKKFTKITLSVMTKKRDKIT